MSGRVGAVLVAAGAARRMGFDKVWADLGGRPVLSYSLETLSSSGLIDQLVLVVAPSRLDEARAVASLFEETVLVCQGGAERRDSVEAGFHQLRDCTWVLVHDAARPFVALDLIQRGLHAARRTGAAVAAMPVRDTIKRVLDNKVVQTLARNELWSAQTPQVFRADLLQAALGSSEYDVTDEATLVERLGNEVQVFRGSDMNWKITTPHDLELATAVLALWDRERELTVADAAGLTECHG